MRIYLKKNIAKFHPYPILNDGTVGFFDERRPNKSKHMQEHEQE